MPGREAVACAVEPQRDLEHLSGCDRLGGGVPVAVGQVEDAAGHEQRLARRRHVAQPRGDERLGLIGGDAQRQLREAQRLDRVAQRGRVEAQREGVVLALVERLARSAVGAPVAGREAVRLRRSDRQRGHVRRCSSERPVAEREAVGGGRRPGPRRGPATAARDVVARGPVVVLDVGAQERLAVVAVVVAAQVVAEEARALVEEGDLRAGRGVVRIAVRPRPDQPEAIAGQVLDEVEHRVAIGVRPAADGEHRAGDVAVAERDRAVPPVLVLQLVREPGLDHRRRDVQPSLPGRAPAVADDRRIGRPRVEGEHRRRPREHVVRVDAAADVVAVVGVSPHGRVDGDDGAELRRPASGDLEPGEPAPRVADHPDAPVAPGLLREPGDDLDGVVLLLGEVLVVDQAVGVARAADVDAHAGEAALGPPGVARLVALARAVGAAVGDRLQDHRRRARADVVGQPDPRRQAAAVGERDPDRVEDGHAREAQSCSTSGRPAEV